MKRALIKHVLSSPAGESITTGGWVRTRRDSRGGFSFVELNDGSCFASLQVVVDAKLENYDSEVLHLSTGSSVLVEGILQSSPGEKQATELHARRVQVLGLAPDDYPLQKKRHSFEFLRSQAHLRARTNTFGAIGRLRSQVSFAIHSFFQERDFCFIPTPIITASDCEGAGHLFRVTTLELENLPRENGRVAYERDFFGEPVYLSVSGQLEGETQALALSNIYTFGPTFRAENSNTSRHLAEFWMVEPEMAFYQLEDDARLAEEFLKCIFRHVLDRCGEDLKFFDQWIEKGLIKRLEVLAEHDFEMLSYSDAIDILKKSKKPFEFPVEWGRDLQSEHERFLTEEHVKGPVIVTDYPTEIKAFYMRLNDDGRTVRAMDVLVPGVGEIIGGSEREERFDVLKERMLKQGLSLEDYQWYLDLRRFGSVPHSGFGLGFERLVQFVSGMENIRDVSPFPRTPGHAGF